MYCAQCGSLAQPGAAFCPYCGTRLPAALPGSAGLPEVMEPAPQPPAPLTPKRQTGAGGRKTPANTDPRKQQLRALKLELKQLRLELRQVNMQLQQIRTQHRQGSPFVPWGLANRIYREVENIQLSNPEQRKQQLQQQILMVEQQILNLESQIGG
jgi:DNA-binding transcriptional MerR regulator